MADARREIYSSPNGDRWFLARDEASAQPLILHVPNAASGGRESHIQLGAFLARGANGPEHQELLRLIATLVEAA